MECAVQQEWAYENSGRVFISMECDDGLHSELVQHSVGVCVNRTATFSTNEMD